MGQPDDRSHLPHELDGGLGARARIGLIVLATDQTIEHEWRLIFQGLDGVALYQSRIWNDAADHARDADAHGGQARRERRRHHARPAAGVARLRLHVGRHGDRRGAGVRPAARGPPRGQADHADHGRLRGLPRASGPGGWPCSPPTAPT